LETYKGRESDRKMLCEMDRDRLVDFFFAHMRSLFSVDGLYFIGIEEKYGTESATAIDAYVWETMGKIEARRLRDVLGVTENDLHAFMKILRYTSWSLDLEDKEIEVSETKGVFRTLKCRVQKTRVAKGLGEFSCKGVRGGYLEAFAREFNPDIEVKCNICPPDGHPDDLWCEWEFSIRRSQQ
jgi:hypothetical protein